jgi:hypothetical protein
MMGMDPSMFTPEMIVRARATRPSRASAPHRASVAKKI